MSLEDTRGWLATDEAKPSFHCATQFRALFIVRRM